MTFSIRYSCYGLSLSLLLLAMTTVRAQSQTQASCNFKVFHLPESVASSPNGINDDGTVVGLAVDIGGGERGFTRSPGGVLTYYGAPNAEPTYRSYTYFTGRNQSGVKIGNYAENKTGAVQKGFMLSGSSFTSVAFPKAVQATYANGINKWNSVVGYYIDSVGNGHAHSFKRFKKGSYITLNYPAAEQTLATGINDSGAIVGYYFSSTQPSGFIYFNGKWATLDYPKATATTLSGISNTGVIIGHSNTTKQGTAFLYENGTFKVISVPNSFSTMANGISADGSITGRTNLDNTATGWRGFTAVCR
jgi:probable HAF family extracellular repeat protein